MNRSKEKLAVIGDRGNQFSIKISYPEYKAEVGFLFTEIQSKKTFAIGSNIKLIKFQDGYAILEVGRSLFIQSTSIN